MKSQKPNEIIANVNKALFVFVIINWLPKARKYWKTGGKSENFHNTLPFITITLNGNDDLVFSLNHWCLNNF